MPPEALAQQPGWRSGSRPSRCSLGASPSPGLRHEGIPALPCLTAVSRPRLGTDGPAPASGHLLPGRSRQTPANGPRTFPPRADRAGCGAPHASHGPAAGPGASVPPLSPGRCGLYKACKTTPARSPLGRAGGRAACQAFPAPGSRASPSEAPGRGGPERADTPHPSSAGRGPSAPGVPSVHRLGSSSAYGWEAPP